MLKLLKYEMIQSYRQYFLTLGIFLILCVLAPLLPDFISQVLSSLMICNVRYINCSFGQCYYKF